MTKPLVLFHANCWDGFCAAWVAHCALGDIDAVPVHYGQSPPDVKARNVHILDFSYKRPDMWRIIESAQSVLVLDHHKTAQAELADIHADNITIQFDMEKSGGRLAWNYYMGNSPSPWLVDYTEDRDLWKHALPHTQEINAALRSYPLDFAVWDAFERVSALDSVIVEGAAIRRAEQQIVDAHVRNAHEVTFDGHQILVVNATVLFSEIAGTLAINRPFGACYFDRQDGKRQWSLRSRDGGVDVSTIAQRRGGGGHRQAAGFEESTIECAVRPARFWR